MTSEIIIQAIVTGLMMGLIYALIAAGLSLIFGLMEIVNFAHGEHLMLSMFSSFWLWSLFGCFFWFVLVCNKNRNWISSSSNSTR